MSETLTVFLVFLLLLGAVTRETFVIVLIYLGVGSLLLSRWWSARVLSNLRFARHFEKKVFPDETVQVKIELTNRTILPAVWMRIQDYYPIEVADVRTFNQVLTLGPRERITLEYNLKARKRGYYAIGPLEMSTGDLLGFSADQTSTGLPDFLTVYPKVIPLTDPFLPSRSPMGTLRHRLPIFEDPSRPVGKRDYQAGDSLHRIDWKATASSGKLQVKQFEPSIALETAIFLNLNLDEYSTKDRVGGTELAIVAAASLANWAIAKRQSAGLFTNGADQLNPTAASAPIPPRKGRAHLMRMLEGMARIKARETTNLAQLLRQYRSSLSWGTTLILITGSADHELFDEIIQAQRSGMSVVLILCGWYTGVTEARQRARTAGIVLVDIPDDDAFKAWQR